MYYYSRLFFWREIYQAYDLQSRSLKYFVIMGDNSERDKYREQYELISKRANDFQAPDKDLSKWLIAYNQINASVEKHSTSDRAKSSLTAGPLTFPNAAM